MKQEEAIVREVLELNKGQNACQSNYKTTMLIWKNSKHILKAKYVS